MEFNTPWKRKKVEPEKNKGKSLVEKGSYIPAQQQIENMILAGNRLSEYRREMYDYGPDDEDDGQMDPTRCPNYDMADAHADQKAVEARLLAQQAAAKEKKDVQVQEVKKDEPEAETGNTST